MSKDERRNMRMNACQAFRRVVVRGHAVRRAAVIRVNRLASHAARITKSATSWTRRHYVAILALIPLAAIFGSMLLSLGGHPRLYSTENTAKAMDNLVLEAPGDKQPFATVLLTILDLDPSAKTIRCIVSLRLTSNLFENGFQQVPELRANGSELIDVTGGLKPEFADKTIDLSLSGPLTEDIHVPIPLTDYQPWNGSIGDVVTTLPATRLGSYPVDKWLVSFIARLALPEGLTMRLEGASDQEDPIPLVAGVAQHISFHDWDLQSSPSIGVPDYTIRQPPHVTSSVATAIATLGRSSEVLLFAAGVGIIPFVIGVAFMRGKDFDQNAGLSLAATMVSFFAIREVVVPTDIRGLTDFDILLGYELAAILALLVITSVRSRKASLRVEEEEPDPGRSSSTE